MHPDRAHDTPALRGESLDDAVAIAVDRTDHSERDARVLLDTITVDGRVSADRFDEVLGETATYVSTPETRLEFADHALAAVRELADPHDDVPTVTHRRTGLEERFTEIEAAVTDLASDLQDFLAEAETSGNAPDPSGLLTGLERVQTVRERADRLAGRADELADDIESSERWLKVPVARHEALELDLDHLDQRLDELADTDIETLQTARQRQLARHHRVLGLVVDDVRQELADVRTLDDRADADHSETLDALVFRLDQLARTHQSFAPPRDALADETVADLDTLDDALESLDAPIDWASVEAAVASLDSEDGPAQHT